jgi:hypothetical protein
MDSSHSFQPSRRRRRAPAIAAVLVVVAAAATAFVAPTIAQATSGAGAASAQAAAAREAALARTVSDVPTLSSQNSADVANLGVIPASMSCAQLAKTTSVGGQKIQIVEYQTASASAGSPKYCAVRGRLGSMA